MSCNLLISFIDGFELEDDLIPEITDMPEDISEPIEPPPPPWWNPSWMHRKHITISNSISGYQMKLIVHRYDDVNNAQIDCESHCKSDFSDLRFVDLSGTTLYDYWIEDKIEDDYCIIWINTPGENNLYMYYGNSEAMSTSDGYAVWEYFEDWETDNCVYYTKYTSGSGHRHGAWNAPIGDPVNISDGVRILFFDAPTYINWNSYGVTVFNGLLGTLQDYTDATDFIAFRFYGDTDEGISGNQIQCYLYTVSAGAGASSAPSILPFTINQFMVYEIIGNTTQLTVKLYGGNSHSSLLYNESVLTNIPDSLVYKGYGSYHGSDDPYSNDFCYYISGESAIQWGAYNSGRSTLKYLNRWTCIGKYQDPGPEWIYFEGEE